MRKILVFIITVIALVLLFPLPCRALFPLKTAPTYEQRDISVCVLLDEGNTIDKSEIQLALKNVFTEYHAKVGLNFTAQSFAFYQGDHKDFSFEKNSNLAKLCGDEDVIIGFTNEKLFEKDKDGNSTGVSYYGMSYTEMGALLIFGTKELATAKDADQNPAIELVLKHEIAHWFGTDDTDDKSEFMYCCNNSDASSNWSEETIRIIRAHLHQTWKR